MLLAFAVPPDVVAATATSSEREAKDAFRRADYGTVLKLLPPASSGITPSKAWLRLAVDSAIHVGRPEEGLEIYDRLVKPGQPEEVPLLQRLGIGFLRAYVRDSREHLRIAAYSALAAS